MMLFGTLSDTCLDWKRTMTNERYVITETVTRTVEAEGENNVRHLKALAENRGVPMNPGGPSLASEESEPPETKSREPAPSEPPTGPDEATVATPETESASNALPTPGEPVGKLGRKAWNDARETFDMIGEDLRSVADKLLTGPQATPEQDRARKEPEDRQTG